MLDNFNCRTSITAIDLINEFDVKHVKRLVKRACDVRHAK